VEQTLVHSRHQLAVLRKQSFGAEQNHRVVEAARPIGLPLVDAHHAVDVVLSTCGDELVDPGSRDVDRVLPQARPHLVEAIETSRFIRPTA
jgi:hypothetical protein